MYHRPQGYSKPLLNTNKLVILRSCHCHLVHVYYTSGVVLAPYLLENTTFNQYVLYNCIHRRSIANFHSRQREPRCRYTTAINSSHMTCRGTVNTDLGLYQFQLSSYYNRRNEPMLPFYPIQKQPATFYKLSIDFFHQFAFT